LCNLQAGRLLWIGFRGTSVTDEPLLAALAAEGLIGGVLLLARNVQDEAQLTRLCAQIHALTSPHRLGICIDQEGGRVSRLPWLQVPPARQVAHTTTPAGAETLYGQMARSLRRCGVDWNLAPVVDVDVNPVSPAIGAWQRSYSAEEDDVTDYASAFVRAHRTAGVRTCHKHYPGHGSAGEDTHQGLADITGTWSERELTPYRNMLQEGLVDAVMPGHLLHRSVDNYWPASLSAAHMRLLRTQLGWQGVVVSDDMQMGALSGLGSTAECMLRALNLGVDVFLAGNWLTYDLELPRRWAAMIEQAILQHQLAEQRLVEAGERLTRLIG